MIFFLNLVLFFDFFVRTRQTQRRIVHSRNFWGRRNVHGVGSKHFLYFALLFLSFVHLSLFLLQRRVFIELLLLLLLTFTLAFLIRRCLLTGLRRSLLDVVKVEEGAGLVECLLDLLHALPRALQVLLVLMALRQQANTALQVAQNIEVTGEKSTYCAEGGHYDLLLVFQSAFQVCRSLLLQCASTKRRVLRNILYLHGDVSGKDDIRRRLKLLCVLKFVKHVDVMDA